MYSPTFDRPLHSLYQAFDEIAIRRKVFKVETIGDCYVAVAVSSFGCVPFRSLLTFLSLTAGITRTAGKPPSVAFFIINSIWLQQEKNAVIMAKFANECMEKMRELVAALALTLGPDTAELDLRVGLHSGPVTGGVLRGQRSRFQLFGPTMNQVSCAWLIECHVLRLFPRHREWKVLVFLDVSTCRKKQLLSSRSMEKHHGLKIG